MSVWLLVAMLGSTVLDFDLFYTSARCEQFASIVRSHGGFAACREMAIKE